MKSKNVLFKSNMKKIKYIKIRKLPSKKIINQTID